MYECSEIMFSETFQAKVIIGVFGFLCICALIGAFWNPWQLVIAAMCATMVLVGISELNKTK